MTARLGADVIILHIPGEPDDPMEAAAVRERLWRSVDDLLAPISDCGVRIAFENMIRDNVPLLQEVMLRYSPESIGVCYDAGHGNIHPNEGLRDLATLRDRLISVHLHDNDGRQGIALELTGSAESDVWLYVFDDDGEGCAQRFEKVPPFRGNTTVTLT